MAVGGLLFSVEGKAENGQEQILAVDNNDIDFGQVLPGQLLKYKFVCPLTYLRASYRKATVGFG